MASQQQQTTETAPSPPVSKDVRDLARSMAEFSLDLYQKLGENSPDRNLFFSPLSICAALGMTYAGAQNNTAAQMGQVLKFQSLGDEVHSAFNKLLGHLYNADDQYVLSSANRVYVDKKFKLLEKFSDLVKSSFQSEVSNVNFVGDTEGARSTINQWVEEETVQKIKNLIPMGVLTPATTLVLVNAIYFKGNWERKFKSEATVTKPFRVSNTKQVQMDMMFQSAKFPLGRLVELDCQVLELPYVQNDLSMVLMLPRKPEGLRRLEESITPAILQSVSSFVEPQTVAVTLPKFKLEEGAELSKLLSSLGMSDLFTAGKADLSGIDGTKDLFVSNVIHKAFVEVNEEGTEAAAATAVVMSRRAAILPQQFTADHPFLFFIRHNKTGAILFMGRLSQPKETAVASKEEL